MIKQVTVAWDGNARKIISRVSEKDRSDLTIFIPFLLVHDYLFDDPTSLKYICKGFQVFLLYIRGKSYGPSIFKQCLRPIYFPRTRDVVYTFFIGTCLSF